MSFITQAQPPYFGTGGSQQTYSNTAPGQAKAYELPYTDDFVLKPAVATIGAVATFDTIQGRTLQSSTSLSLQNLALTNLSPNASTDVLVLDPTTKQIGLGSGSGGSYVTLDTVQTITAAKTWDDDQTYNGTIITNYIDMGTDGLLIATGSEFQIGTNANKPLIIDSGTGTIQISSGQIQINGPSLDMDAAAAVIKFQNNNFIHNQGTASTYVGIGAGNFTQVGATNNTGIGNNALAAIAAGDFNTSIGALAGQTITNVVDTTCVGYRAGQSSGAYSTYVGSNSGPNCTGMFNACCGMNTALLASSSQSLALLGHNAGFSLTSGSNNTLLGRQAGGGITSGGSNVAIGNSTMNAAAAGSNNVAIGSTAMTLSTGDSNVVIGYQAGTFANLTSNNTIIGALAGQSTQVITGNTIIGANAGSLGGTNNVIIANTGATGDNQIIIGDNSHLTTVITGINETTTATADKIMTITSADKLGVQDEFTSTAAVMTLDSGAITSSLLRGVVQGTAGTMSGIRIVKAGRMCWCSIPSWEVNTDSGSPSVVKILATGTIPAAFRPTLYNYATSAPIYNGGSQVSPNALIQVTTTGAMLCMFAGTFTTNYGMISGDFTFSYMI